MAAVLFAVSSLPTVLYAETEENITLLYGVPFQVQEKREEIREIYRWSLEWIDWKTHYLENRRDELKNSTSPKVQHFNRLIQELKALNTSPILKIGKAYDLVRNATQESMKNPQDTLTIQEALVQKRGVCRHSIWLLQYVLDQLKLDDLKAYPLHGEIMGEGQQLGRPRRHMWMRVQIRDHQTKETYDLDPNRYPKFTLLPPRQIRKDDRPVKYEFKGQLPVLPSEY